MLITLYGPDSYRRLQKQKSILSKYLEKFTGLSFKKFDFEELTDFENFKSFISSQSLFESKKICLINNPFLADFQKESKKIFKNHEEKKEMIIILSSNKKPSVVFSFLLKSPNQNQEFKNLEGSHLIKFIKEEAEKRNLSLSPKEINNISSYFEKDSWEIINQLEKISLSKNFRKETSLKSYDFFFLIKNLISPDLNKRLSAFELLIFQNEDPAKILNTLSYQSGIKKAKLADADLAVKSGKLEYKEALLDFILF